MEILVVVQWGGYWVNKQYKFKYVEEPLLDGEIFKPLGVYQVSSKGRVKMKRGNITVGSNLSGNNSKYRAVLIKLYGDVVKRHYLVHTLVWMAHVGPISNGHVIMHDDKVHTLDEEGCERNHLEDLSVGTQQQNMQSYHDNRTDLKRVRCIDNNTIYFSAAVAARELELDGSHIHKVCCKKLKTTGGKRFEYC